MLGFIKPIHNGNVKRSLVIYNGKSLSSIKFSNFHKIQNKCSKPRLYFLVVSLQNFVVQNQIWIDLQQFEKHSESAPL